MKNREVIDRLKQFHNMSPDYVGCDEYKAGNPNDECRGIFQTVYSLKRKQR